MRTSSFNKFKRVYYDPTHEYYKHLRFGQCFCNLYIKKIEKDFDVLYNADRDLAEDLIQKWLIEHCYVEDLPNRL